MGAEYKLKDDVKRVTDTIEESYFNSTSSSRRVLFLCIPFIRHAAVMALCTIYLLDNHCQ